MAKLVQLYKNNQPVYVEAEKVEFFLTLTGFSKEIVPPKKVASSSVVEKKPESVDPVGASILVEGREEKEVPKRKRASILEGLE